MEKLEGHEVGYAYKLKKIYIIVANSYSHLKMSFCFNNILLFVYYASITLKVCFAP